MEEYYTAAREKNLNANVYTFKEQRYAQPKIITCTNQPHNNSY